LKELFVERERKEGGMQFFPWDGSDLGNLTEEELVVTSTTLDGKDFWLLNTGEHCISKCCKPEEAIFSSLVYEVKPFFGVCKNGTHRATVGGKSYHLTQQLTFGEELCWEPALSTIPLENSIRQDRFFREEVKRIFVLRELFAMGGYYERNITLREVPNKNPLCPKRYHAMSVNETPGSGKKRVVISELLRSRWFQEETISQVSRRMCSFKGDPVETFAGAREHLTSAAERLDKNSVVYINVVLERLSSYLSSFS